MTLEHDHAAHEHDHSAHDHGEHENSGHEGHDHSGHDHAGHEGHDHSGHGHVSYPEAVANFRAQKDDYFRSAHDSPIPHDARHDFAGLPYFPVDEALRFEGLTLEPYAGSEPAQFQIPTSDGKLRDAERAGVLRFDLGGARQALTGYTFAAGGSESAVAELSAAYSRRMAENREEMLGCRASARKDALAKEVAAARAHLEKETRALAAAISAKVLGRAS